MNEEDTIAISGYKNPYSYKSNMKKGFRSDCRKEEDEAFDKFLTSQYYGNNKK